MDGELFERRFRIIYGKKTYDRGTGKYMVLVQKKSCPVNNIL